MLLAAVTVSMTASAVQRVALPVICTDGATMAETLATYGELPMMTMMTTREGSEDSATVMFANPETRSWTLVEEIRDDVYCAVSMGQGLAPYQPRAQL